MTTLLVVILDDQAIIQFNGFDSVSADLNLGFYLDIITTK